MCTTCTYIECVKSQLICACKFITFLLHTRHSFFTPYAMCRVTATAPSVRRHCPPFVFFIITSHRCFAKGWKESHSFSYICKAFILCFTNVVVRRRSALF